MLKLQCIRKIGEHIKKNLNFVSKIKALLSKYKNVVNFQYR